MKLLEIIDIMNIKEHYQLWSKIFFDKKIGSVISVNKQLAEELYKPITETFK